MIITYEVGDTVEVTDDEDVPFYLAATTVKLKEKLPNKNWKVEVVWNVGQPIGNGPFILNEGWMLT